MPVCRRGPSRRRQAGRGCDILVRRLAGIDSRFTSRRDHGACVPDGWSGSGVWSLDEDGRLAALAGLGGGKRVSLLPQARSCRGGSDPDARRRAAVAYMTAPRLTVWFDSGCPLCSREIALMRRMDRHGAISFVDACDPAVICPVDRRQILARFHASENGRLLSGAAAFAAMWRAIPVLRPLGVVAGWPGVDRVFELAYRGFLRLRPLLQRALR